MATDETARRMIYHAAVVIWLGLLAGFPFGLVIMDRMPGEARGGGCCPGELERGE